MLQKLTGNSLSCRCMQCCPTLQHTQVLLPLHPYDNKPHRCTWSWAMCIFERQTHAGAEHKPLEWSHLRASQSHISTMRQQCLDNLQMTKMGSNIKRSASLHSKSKHTSTTLYCWTKHADHSRSGTYQQASSLHYKIPDSYLRTSVVNFYASGRQQIVQQHQVTTAGGEVQILHCTYDPVHGN